MFASKDNVKSGLPKTAEWMICLPCLAFWPFLSALPAFSFFGPDLNASAITLNILLLVTGFWPLFLGFCARKYLLTDAGRKQQKVPTGEGGLHVGYYATGWTLIYLALAMSRSA